MSEIPAEILTEEAFWAAAERDAIAAMRSPLFDLLTLASPERWLALETTNLSIWIFYAIRHLTPVQQRLFACDCAEHLLPHHRNSRFYTPIDKSLLEEAITLARSYAKGAVVVEDEVRAIQGRILQGGTHGYDVAQPNLCEAVRSTLERNPHSASINASSEAIDFMQGQRSASDLVATKKELQWQWRRVLSYLRGDVDD